MTDQATFLRPGIRKTSGGHVVVDGVQFVSYDVGVLRYAKISEDGQIFVQRRHRRQTYFAAVIGVGDLKNPSGRLKSFRTEEAAMRAGIKAFKERARG
jgi:hypothetical protein